MSFDFQRGQHKKVDFWVWLKSMAHRWDDVGFFARYVQDLYQTWPTSVVANPIEKLPNFFKNEFASAKRKAPGSELSLWSFSAGTRLNRAKRGCDQAVAEYRALLP